MPPTLLEMMIPGHILGFSTQRRRNRLLVMAAQQCHYLLARYCNAPNIGVISNIAHRGYCVKKCKGVELCRKTVTFTRVIISSKSAIYRGEIALP
jgi:hypothetical protein